MIEQSPVTVEIPGSLKIFKEIIFLVTLLYINIISALFG